MERFDLFRRLLQEVYDMCPGSFTRPDITKNAVVKMWYEKTMHVPIEALCDIFERFAVKGQFPSIEQVLKESGSLGPDDLENVSGLIYEALSYGKARYGDAMGFLMSKHHLLPGYVNERLGSWHVLCDLTDYDFKARRQDMDKGWRSYIASVPVQRREELKALAEKKAMELPAPKAFTEEQKKERKSVLENYREFDPFVRGKDWTPDREDLRLEDAVYATYLKEDKSTQTGYTREKLSDISLQAKRLNDKMNREWEDGLIDWWARLSPEDQKRIDERAVQAAKLDFPGQPWTKRKMSEIIDRIIARRTK